MAAYVVIITALLLLLRCNTWAQPSTMRRRRAVPDAPDSDGYRRHRRRLASVSTLPLPAGLKNQSKEEAEYLKLHKCKDVGEAYSASYLITREHLLEQFTGYNLTWVNCEMGR